MYCEIKISHLFAQTQRGWKDGAMSDSHSEHGGTAEEAKLVGIPEMPDLLEGAGLKRVGPARIRQLAVEPGFPAPVYEHGRVRLWDWSSVETFFRRRVLRPGERTDLKHSQEGPTDESADDRG